MISLDQVLLLQKKVETAVEKIAFLKGQIEQLKSENDALRTQCAELTKALNDKTELVSSLESNQGKIEETILSALNRLDTVENSILNGPDSSESQVSFDQQATLETVEDSSSGDSEQEQSSENASDTQQDGSAQSSEVQENQPELVVSESDAQQPSQEPFRYEIVPDDSSDEDEDNSNSSDNTAESLNGQFDIF